MSSLAYERIDGPLPLPPLYGLLAAAEAPAAGVQIVPDVDARGIERWLNGVAVYPYPVGLADVWDACAAGTEQGTKGFGEEVPHPLFGAFTLWFAETCTSYQVWNQDEFKQRAVTALAAVESAGLAKEFLTGTRMLSNPHLADGEGVFPNDDTATGVVDGLALLEAEIARSGKFGLIHVSPMIATTLRERFTVDNASGVIRTINGNVVIPDSGYVDGATPAGHTDPGSDVQEWIYATGPIDIRRSEIFTMPDTVDEALDRGTGGAEGAGANSITYRAERYYLIDWDTTLQAAVLVDRCDDDCVRPT